MERAPGPRTADRLPGRWRAWSAARRPPRRPALSGPCLGVRLPAFASFLRRYLAPVGRRSGNEVAWKCGGPVEAEACTARSARSAQHVPAVQLLAPLRRAPFFPVLLHISLRAIAEAGRRLKRPARPLRTRSFSRPPWTIRTPTKLWAFAPRKQQLLLVLFQEGTTADGIVCRVGLAEPPAPQTVASATAAGRHCRAVKESGQDERRALLGFSKPREGTNGQGEKVLARR